MRSTHRVAQPPQTPLGANNIATLSSATWSPTGGKYGGAVSLNGTSSLISVPASAGLDLANMTLEAWVRPTGSVSGARTLIAKERPGGGFPYGLEANGGVPGTYATTGGTFARADGTTSLGLNTWRFVAATYDGATLRLYVDGTQVASKAATGSIATSTSPLRIGGDAVWGEYFQGLIDNVRVYSRAVSATELQTDMNTPVTSGSVPDTQAPSTPTGLVAGSATASAITLSWASSTDNVAVAGYGVYNNGVLQGSPTATGHTLTGLACGTSYTAAVDAFDAAGNRSGKATITTSTAACADTAPPSTPTGLAASAPTQTALTLNWAASTDNIGIAGYGVYSNGTLKGSPTVTNYTLTGLACGTSYTVAVDAFDAAGNRSAKATITTSTAACADTAPPSVPAGLAVSSSTQTTLSLTWSASTDNVAVAGYGVYSNGTLKGSPTATNYALTGLTCGTSYTVAVDAFDAAANRSAKATITTSTVACPDTTAPTTPTGLAAGSVGQTSITLSWTASTDNVAVDRLRRLQQRHASRARPRRPTTPSPGLPAAPATRSPSTPSTPPETAPPRRRSPRAPRPAPTRLRPRSRPGSRGAPRPRRPSR